MTSPNQGQLDLLRRYPKVADASGAGQGQPNAQPSTGGGALAAPNALPSGNNWVPANWQAPQQAPATGAAPAATPTPTQQPSFSPTQTAALSQADPNFLLNYYSRPQSNAQPAPTGTSLPQTQGASGTPTGSILGGLSGALPGQTNDAPQMPNQAPQNQLPALAQLNANANLQYPTLQSIIGYGNYSQPGYGI